MLDAFRYAEQNVMQYRSDTLNDGVSSMGSACRSGYLAATSTSAVSGIIDLTHSDDDTDEKRANLSVWNWNGEGKNIALLFFLYLLPVGTTHTHRLVVVGFVFLFHFLTLPLARYPPGGGTAAAAVAGNHDPSSK